MTEALVIHQHCPVNYYVLIQRWRAKDPEAFRDWDLARLADTMRALKYDDQAAKVEALRR